MNTTGAIIGSLVIPFVLMPTIGSPAIVVLLALSNAALGIGLALYVRPRRTALAGAGVVAAVLIVVLATRPGLVVQPNEARIAARGATLFESREDEIASVQAGQDRATPELWVGGTSMTLLTVDAKLMPILPLIARPESKRALVVAFGMGTAFRSALIAGLRTDAVELVPSVPKMFGYYYDDADRSSRTRTDGSSSPTAGTTSSSSTSISTSSSRTRRRRSRARACRSSRHSSITRPVATTSRTAA